jgi:hypothetical protein
LYPCTGTCKESDRKDTEGIPTAIRKEEKVRTIRSGKGKRVSGSTTTKDCIAHKSSKK